MNNLKNKLKIGIVITGLGVGGAENHLLKILPKLKVPVFVISLTNLDQMGSFIENKGIKVYYLGLKKNLLNLPFVIHRFRKIIGKEKPSILDSYLIHANIFTRLFGRIKSVNKIICSVRSDYSYMKVINFIDRLTKNKVDLFIPNSSSLVPYLKKNGVSEKKIKVLYNCIDLNDLYSKVDSNYSLRKELNLSSDRIIILSVARLQKVKCIETSVKALSHLDKKFVLVLAGDGPQNFFLKNLAKERHLEDRVYFLGTRKDVPNLLNSSDIFILSSEIEGMSNSLLEAMAMGKRCVVSNIPQNKELIKDEINGLTFNLYDAVDCAKKIENIIGSNSYGIKAKQNIIDNHDVNKIVEQYLKIIKDIVE